MEIGNEAYMSNITLVHDIVELKAIIMIIIVSSLTMYQARLGMLHDVTHSILVTTNAVGALICISSGKKRFSPLSTVLCFLFVCLKQSSLVVCN